jgi:hypothetical protein
MAEDSTPSHEQGASKLQQTSEPAASAGLDRPATVLFSYAREDRDAVKDLQLRLKARGVRSWRDEDDILPGSLFEWEIVHAIEQEVDAMALYVTAESLKSDFIWKKEIPAALRRQQRDPQFSYCAYSAWGVLQGTTANVQEPQYGGAIPFSRH